MANAGLGGIGVAAIGRPIPLLRRRLVVVRTTAPYEVRPPHGGGLTPLSVGLIAPRPAPDAAVVLESGLAWREYARFAATTIADATDRVAAIDGGPDLAALRTLLDRYDVELRLATGVRTAPILRIAAALAAATEEWEHYVVARGAALMSPGSMTVPLPTEAPFRVRLDPPLPVELEVAYRVEEPLTE